jgi:hypothetical protein
LIQDGGNFGFTVGGENTGTNRKDIVCDKRKEHEAEANNVNRARAWKPAFGDGFMALLK